MWIALGAARGLLYLHEQCYPKVIHWDVKAANIFLDESFEAIVGDFGLAKLSDRRELHVTTAVHGTVGHIAPEYLSTVQSSEKTDVFVLLELITGPKAMDAPNCHVQKGMLLEWVRKLKEGNRPEMKGGGSRLALHKSLPEYTAEDVRGPQGLGQPWGDHKNRPVLRACSFSREYQSDNIVFHD